MIGNYEVANMLRHELMSGRIKDSGYDLQNGRKYVELRCIQFLVDNEYIFDIDPYPGMIQWYKENYNPIAMPQIDKCINKLSNPSSRQAVIFMSNESEYNNPIEMICTMYMHVFLDKITNDTYNLTYIVHMRSSDAVEFRSDLKWHNFIIRNIIKGLVEKYNYKITAHKVIWNADSFQLYDKQFEKILR